MIWLLSNYSSDEYLQFFKIREYGEFDLNKKNIQYTFPSAPIYEESVLDNRFHVRVVISLQNYW